MPEFISYLFHHMLFVEIYLTCIAKWHIKMKKIVIFFALLLKNWTYIWAKCFLILFEMFLGSQIAFKIIAEGDVLSWKKS